MTLIAQTFDQLINFTRTSAATFVGSNGLIQNTPASVNLLTYTQEFDNAAWNKGTSGSISANNAVSPDGTTTADTYTWATATPNYAFLSQSATAVSTNAHTFSIWLKRPAGSGSRTVRLTVSDVTTSSANSSSFTVTEAWQRFEFTRTSANSTGLVGVGLALGVTGTPIAAGEIIEVWGAQLQTGSTATTYTRNFGGRFPPRFDYDPVTLLPRGLLVEEQRTNLMLRSEEFDNAAWNKDNVTATANATTSPDGTSNADTLVENTATTPHRIIAASSFSFVSGTTYTASIFAKNAGRRYLNLNWAVAFNARATFDLQTGTISNTASGTATITDLGNGWYRCTVTNAATVTATNNGYFQLSNSSTGTDTYTGDGTSGLYVWGAQLEAGAFATSYIPTVASQVTRTADVVTIAAPNFAPWYNQSEGTIFVEATAYAGTNSNRYYEFNDGTGSNLIQGFASPSTINTCWVDVGGVGQARLSTSGSPTALTKIAAAVRLNDFAASLNGAAPATDISGTLPTVNRLGIGNNPTGTSALNGHIRSIRYYPVRLTNATLQALTA